MNPLELLRRGDIDQALAALQDQVRHNPADFKCRVFLFQLLVVMGQWDRALTQLNVAGELDAEALAMVQTYREALRCEAFRQEVFAGRRIPVVFGQPQAWVAHLIESFRLLAAGRAVESQPLREKAFEDAPARTGTITAGDKQGERFEWIADADSRFGPVLEAIINGRYYWIPFENVRLLQIEPPADLRDVAWMPAHFQWTNGGETVALLPTRYAGSESSTDPQIRLARKTDWQEAVPGLFTGTGQRMLATNAGEYPLMEIRRIEFDEPSAAAEPAHG
jgi:type VI secretion system protein ImpE